MELVAIPRSRLAPYSYGGRVPMIVPEMRLRVGATAAPPVRSTLSPKARACAEAVAEASFSFAALVRTLRRSASEIVHASREATRSLRNLARSVVYACNPSR